jgi:hypothetical protein
MALSAEEKLKRQLAAVRKYRREKYGQFRTAANAQSKAWRKKNPNKVRAWTDAWTRDPRNMMLAKAKYRAKKTGIDFSITLDDIPVPTHCPLLGVPLIAAKNGKVSRGSPSIDRIVSTLGYVRGNVWVISHRANALKSAFTLEQLEQFVTALRCRTLDRS